MPVPTSVSDLNSTASSNSPAGTDAIGTTLDDYIRAHASIIRQVSDAKADLTSAVLVTPNLGTPSAGVLTNCTGTATALNIGGNAATATTATNQSGGTVAATTISASGLITATGGQIAFPATAVPSANANTLDDYEEGSWIPTGTMSTSGTVTLTNSRIYYTKIGNRVLISGTVVLSSVSSPLGFLTIDGCPFTPYDLNGGLGIFSAGGGASGGPIQGYTDAGTSNLVLCKASGGGLAVFAAGDLLNSQQIYLSGSFVIS